VADRPLRFLSLLNSSSLAMRIQKKQLLFEAAEDNYLPASKLNAKDLIEEKHKDQNRYQYYRPPRDNVIRKIIDVAAH
jgi:hypothetical protein